MSRTTAVVLFGLVVAAVIGVVAYFSIPGGPQVTEAPPAPEPAAADDAYLLATATTGGTYYPVGVALSTLVQTKLKDSHGFAVSAINSAGSGENIRLLLLGEAQFGILQGLFGYNAWAGIGDVDQANVHANLRAVTMLWQNVEQFVCRSEHIAAGTLGDLTTMTGESMAFGRRNSGTIESNRVIVNSLGLDMDGDFDLLDAGYGPSGEALQNGQVACMATPAGVPTGAVTNALAALGDDAAFLTVTDEELATADGGRGLWSRYVIAAETYPGQTQDIATMAQPNFLAVRADVDADHVYAITKAVYENLSFLWEIHAATRAMALEQAIAGIPVPLHPGALRYYEEVGLDIPAHLRAP